MEELAERFRAFNPQWGDNKGQECMDGLCHFVEEPHGMANGHQGAKMSGVKRIKKICTSRIVQHGGGSIEEGRQKREAATNVLKCCCQLEKRYCQVGRGLSLTTYKPQRMGNRQDAEEEEDTNDDGSADSGDEVDIKSEDGEDGSTDSDVEEDKDNEADDMEEDGKTKEGETEADLEIKDGMADIMYICCQRPDKRREMLEKADRRLMKCICNCAKGVLMGDVPITYEEKDNLEKHKKVLRNLCDDTKTTKEKKKIIVQNGGNFLLSLIPTMIGALAGMFQ
jgi:hypothetical protein